MSQNQEIKKEEVALEVAEKVEQNVTEAELSEVSGGGSVTVKGSRTDSAEIKFEW